MWVLNQQCRKFSNEPEDLVAVLKAFKKQLDKDLSNPLRLIAFPLGISICSKLYKILLENSVLFFHHLLSTASKNIHVCCLEPPWWCGLLSLPMQEEVPVPVRSSASKASAAAPTSTPQTNKQTSSSSLTKATKTSGNYKKVKSKNRDQDSFDLEDNDNWPQVRDKYMS